MTRSGTAAVARNALSGGGRFVVAALLALVVTPYALHVLGDEAFGLWALAGALLTTVRVFDLGLNRALVRAVAEADGRGDSAAAGQAMAAGRGVALLLSVAVVALVWLSVDTLVVHVIRVPLDLQPLARRVLMGTAFVAAVEGAFSPFQAGLDGAGRMDLSNGVDTVQRVLSGIGTVVVLALGGGLLGLVAKNVVTAALAGGGYRWALRTWAPELLADRPRLHLDHVRELLRFGRHVQVVATTALAMDVGSKLLLGRVVGLDAVALYELAARVVSQVSGAVIAVAMALFPAAAAVRASASALEKEALVALYRKGTRCLGWLALPAFTLPIVLAAPFVTAWLGPGYAPVQRSMQVLAAGWLVATLAMPAHLVAQAGGRPRDSVLGAVTTAVVALALGAALVVPYGLDGVVAALATGLVTGALVVWQRFGTSFDTGRSTILAVGGRAPASALAGAAVAGLAMGSFARVGGPDPSLLAVAIAGTAGLAVYVALLHITAEVTRDDWVLLREAVWNPSGRQSDPASMERR